MKSSDEVQVKLIPMNQLEAELWKDLMMQMMKMGVVRLSEDEEFEYHPESFPGQF